MGYFFWSNTAVPSEEEAFQTHERGKILAFSLLPGPSFHEIDENQFYYGY